MSKYSKASYTADFILDLFSEYLELAMDYREKGDFEEFKYWSDRTMDLSREYHRIKNDIHKLEKGDDLS